MSCLMKMNKKKFMETEFGSELEDTISAWDKALEAQWFHGYDSEEYKRGMQAALWCQAQWEVYKLALKQFYGVEYCFTRTDEYYGLCTEDERDWLMKVDREQTEFLEYHNSTDEIKEAMRKTREMQRIAGKYKVNSSTCTQISAMDLVSASDERKCKRDALRKALQETMEIVLESELFTNAAKRGIEEYERVVSCNIPMMSDLVLGIYERILHKVRE